MGNLTKLKSSGYALWLLNVAMEAMTHKRFDDLTNS
jgi:hypothetical protein